MAGLLKGLLGALGGALPTQAAAVPGLLGGLDASLSGSPGAVASAPGTGGTVPASDLGDFRLTGRRGVLEALPAMPGEAYTPAPEAPKKPGFLARVSAVDPTTGYSSIDALGEFGARLQDLDDGGARAATYGTQAAGRVAAGKNKLLMAQIDELFGDDPRMRFLLKANPEKASAALADVYKSQNEAYTLGQGQKRGMAGRQIDYAPEVGVTDGYAYSSTPDGGVRFGDQRGQTHGEAETARHNRRTEDLGFGNLGVAQGQLGVSRGNLGLSRERLDFDRKTGTGVGAPAGGVAGMSTADLIAALRGAR